MRQPEPAPGGSSAAGPEGEAGEAGEAAPLTREHLLAMARHGGREPLDLSLGVACDAEPDWFAADGEERSDPGYPKSAGSGALRAAAAASLRRRFQVSLPDESVAVCVGTKEFIASAALFLSREQGGGARHSGTHDSGTRDTVLIPSLCYPTYAVGAELAGLRTVRVPMGDDLRMRLDRVPAADARRALCLWVNSPANPTGVVDALDAIARWGRTHGVLVLSDEAYAEQTWKHRAATILSSGVDGVLAVHSLSKRSHAPGLRVGFYAGDPRLVRALADRRRDAGLMAATPAQTAAVRLLTEDHRVTRQRRRTRHRVTSLVELLNAAGLRCAPPEGGMFVWLKAPGGDGDRFVRWAARTAGLVLAPGSWYGPAGRPWVRVAATEEPETVRPRLELLAASPSPVG
ncbi:pyridoxal phosphate-dependent aminotransferase [Streptomyces jumonjinensis]|uniref:Aminotransferase class I/II-fold pyridoxal phosphate-dependent enzyme n=1 Tax=Streptomyces jumonjinensis TaxID=1945 RepID=A0A646KJP4_STRJU|nr:pyridoxal phosphate-dependent aminotransferase [Streptomyces jumonjinensis]MQT02499.1 aminotransferase class I/II-fold pyridoxal phosphate-dependent enzyme [Streptomyces jumonjinensis]